MPKIKHGEFMIQSFDPDYTFRAEFGDGAPMPDPDSYVGWSVTDIPKRMGLTEWAGRHPLLIPISFIIDRFEEGNGEYVERQRDRLERIAGRNSINDEPPVCIVETGGLMPHDYTHQPHALWVVEALEWDDDLTIISKWNRPLRLGGTVTMRQYNHDDVLDSYGGPAKKNRDKHKGSHKGHSKGKGKPYTVKQGDTLTSIAKRRLGDSKRWKEIANLNNIRNPRSLKVGQVLRMPKK